MIFPKQNPNGHKEDPAQVLQNIRISIVSYTFTFQNLVHVWFHKTIGKWTFSFQTVS